MAKKRILPILILIFVFLNLEMCFSAPWINMNITYDGKVHNYNAENVYLYVNGKRVENLSMPAIILDGSTLVPAREVFEPLGADVTWDKENETVNVSYKDNLIKIKVNSQTADINGNSAQLSVPAKIINNKTMIPARFIAQSLGMKVEWSQDTRIINIREVNVLPSDIGIEIPTDKFTEVSTETAEQTTEVQTELTTERVTEKSSETTTERAPVDLQEPDFDDGILEIKANGNIGDFAQNKISKNKAVYILSKVNMPEKKKYTFDNDYIDKVEFKEITLNNKKFVEITVYFNEDSDENKNPVAYISKNQKTFIVDFVNDEPVYEELYPVDVDSDNDDEPLSSDSDIPEDFYIDPDN